MNFPDTDRLAQLFSEHPEIELVYLFGSHAKGCARPDSDLDLGVSAVTDNYATLKLALLEELAAARFENVDLSFMQQATPLLRFQMVRHNTLIYCRADVSAGTIFSRCLNEYFDLEPTLRVQREAYKKRVLKG